MQLGNVGIRNILLHKYVTNGMPFRTQKESVCVRHGQSWDLHTSMLSDDPGLESVDVFWEYECVSVCVCVRKSASLALLMLHLC